MDFTPEKKEKLNRLEKKLYSRNAPDIIDPGRSNFDDRHLGDWEEVSNEDWSNVKNNTFDELAAKMSQVAQKKHYIVNKIFVGSIIFFVVSIGIAAYMFLGGGNVVSSKNVDIRVVGPISVPGGQEVSFDVDIVNKNNTSLMGASLVVEYPEGSRYATDLTKKLDQERFVIETIKPGEEYRQNIKAAFFGEKDNTKEIKISLEYRVENSSALFYKEKNYEISISSAPIIVTPIYPKEINSNQEVSFEIELVSNSKDNINNLMVNTEYPFGFVFKDASPAASFGNNNWQFSMLKPTEKKTIKIRGVMIGQDNEEKVFKINTGTTNSDDLKTIAVPLSNLVESILVKKPFIGLNLLVNNKDSDIAVQGGGGVSADVQISNNLTSKLFNVTVEATLKGGAFNPQTVSPGNNGFFQSFNNTIIWDKRSVSEFSEINPGFQKDISFNFNPLTYAKVPPGVKPEVEIVVTVKGERILDSGSSDIVSVTETKKVVLGTDIVLLAKLYRAIGNIENSGPIPPKVNMPTTYTVGWEINNSFNQVSNIEVRATLPSYVKFTGVSTPVGENISFDQVTNQVVWKAGSVLPNTGFGSTKKRVFFQLEFLPSSSQIDQSPMIIDNATLSGIDKVTGLKIETMAGSLNTSFSADNTFNIGDEKVTQ